jgi:glycosyltransferase involved in cell wall biosynthesis
LTAIRTRCLLSIQPASDGGGSETALIRMIAQLVAEGWECHVAVPSAARLADEYAAAGAAVHIVPMHRITTTEGLGYWLRYLRDWPVSVARLVLLAHRVGAGVVHSNSLHSWYGWAVAPLVRRPHVWHAREIVVQSALALGVERVLARRAATMVVAMSSAIASQLDPFNVVVVIDDPDPEVWRPARAGAFRAAAGIADDVALVGSVARIDTWKGFDILLDAVPSIQQRHPGVVVVVAGAPVGGKDDYAAALAARAEALGGVRWLGARRDVPDLMADLDVFVQVSTAPEPFGLVHVEALASGVPIVAGDEGGPVEILAGAEAGAGLLVPAGDAAALADAVSTLLAAAPPSRTETRRARRRLRPSGLGRYAALFEPLRSGTIRPRPVAGTASPSPVPPPSR